MNETTVTTIDKKGIVAAKTAVFVDRSDLGMLKVTGETRLDLLNRMSTQAVDKLQSGEGSATILTTDIGRMIDRLLLYASSDAVYALTGANNAQAIARYLMRYVFYNDDFHLKDLSTETAVFGLYGPQAQQKLAAMGFTEVELPLHHWRQQTIDDLTLYLHKTDPVAGDGYFVMCHADEKTAVQTLFTQNGISEIDTATFDYLRIADGVPLFGHEISEAYIPLETGLWQDVSFHKGCYIGQEIIARMESRGRLAKKLVQFRAEQPLAVGTAIKADGKKVGSLTSVANGPTGTVALGYVKTAVLQDNSLTLSANAIPLEQMPGT